MALNPFDDAVDELPPAPQAPASNPYDAIVNEHQQENDARLRTTVQQAATQTPDRAAEARKYADRYGLPPAVVEHNFDVYKRKAALDDVSHVAGHAPLLGDWLAQSPSNAAVAQDDLSTLSAFDRVAGFARRALGDPRVAGFARRALGDPAISLLKGAIALPESAVGLADIVTGGHVGKALEDYAGYQPELASKILATFYSNAQQGAFRSVSEADGAIATAVAALSNPSVIAHSVLESLPLLLSSAAAGAALPFVSPALAGAIGEGAQQAGSAAEQSRTGNANRLLTPKQAALATASGVVDTAISSFGGKLAERLGIADVDTLLAGGAVSPKARHGLVAQVLFGALEEGFVEELPQSVQEQVLQNVADGRPVSEGVDEAAVLGALSGAVMGGGANIYEHVQEHFLKSIGELAPESKTITRDPKAAEDFLATAMKDGPLEHLYAPIDTFTTYWQGKGQDPAAIAAALTGDPEAYPTAVAHGDADLVIPTAAYIAQLAGTEHHKYFEQELRVSPDLQNGRERAAYEAEQAAAETDQADAAPTVRDLMRGALTEQLTTSGYLPRDAEANARLVESAFATMAESAGEDPFQILRDRGLEISRPDLDTSRRSPAGQVGTTAAAIPPSPDTPAGDVAPAAAELSQDAAERIAALEHDLRAATRAAEVDALTGIANRAALDKALPTAESDPETRVVVFDANNFGQVNKLAGHDAGDAMLQKMSAAIVEAATESGVGERVFRRGGDEFVVLAPAAVAEQVRARAEELFGTPSVSGDASPVVSLSGTMGNTFREADAGLQAAKAAAKAQRPAVPESPLESLQRTGVATAPGLRVRVLPTSGPDGEFELEITEKGRRTFEGKFSLEEAQRAGADRLAELVRNPTPAIVTPQIVPAAAPKRKKAETRRGGYDLHNVVLEHEKWLADVYPTGDSWSIRIFNGGQLTLEGSGGDTKEAATAQAAKRFAEIVPGYTPEPAPAATPSEKPQTSGASTYTPEPLTDAENVDYRKLLKLSKGKKALSSEQATALSEFTRRSTDQAYLSYLDSKTDEQLLKQLEGNRSPSNKSRQLGLASTFKHEQQILYVLQQRDVEAPPAPVPVPVGEAVSAALPRILAAYNALPIETVRANLEHLEGLTDNTDAWPEHFPLDAISDFEEAGGAPTTEGWQALTDRAVSALHRLVLDREGQQGLPLAEESLSETTATAVSEPLQAPAAAPIVEEGPDETSASGTDVVDGGRPAGAGDAGEPAGRPGDARAADLAGEQPDPRAPVSAQPRAPRGPRKRRPAASPSVVGAGAATAVAGVDGGKGAGSIAPAHVDTADVAADADVAAAEARGEAPRRFAIDNTATLTEGGWAAKLDDNISAIRLLKALERDGRMATDAEQAVLARYIGWGHTELKDVVEFEGGQSTLANRDPRKQKARDELETLLTQAELKELGESTPNAHYSFADLPRAMWAAVQRLGFRGGSILEPAVGTGHFLGTMPGAIVAQKKTRVFAVEKEPIAAAISRQLYQDTHVQTSPLQDANLPDNYFDLQISNVPFGRISIFDPAFHTSSERRQLDKVHNYYFGKSQDLARPGGIVAFVTSRYTMDSRSDSVRNFLAKRFNLLGAVRLPDQAFKATAGTDVVTDILFLQKRVEGEAPSGPAWQQSPLNEALSPTDYNGNVTNPIHTNEYFQAHPEHVLGTQNLTGKMARTSAPQYNVQGSLTLEQLVDGLNRALPANVYTPSTAAPRQLATVISRDVKQGAFQVEGGELFLYDKGTLAPSDLTGKPRDIAKAFVPLRDAYQGVLDTMVRGGTDAELKKAQQALLGKYKFFVATFGLVNEANNRRVIENDPNAGRIIALERIELVRKKGRRAEIKLLGYADIFTKRTYRPVVEATTADSPAAALTQSLAWKGAVDLPYMAALTGQTEHELVAALGGELYRNPVTQAYEPKAEYLSGDVTTKLAQAQAAALQDAAYKDNVPALMAVLPQQFGAEDFPAPFGATWVPPEVYSRFVQAEMRGSSATVSLVNGETRVHWYVEGGYGRHEFLPAGADAMKWVEHALNGELPVINSGKPPARDQGLTDAYRESLKQLRERWAEWWPTDPVASESLVKIYNGMFNREASYVADGTHLELPGSNPAIALRFWQKNVIWRALQTGNTLIAHAVGAGKTFAMIGVAGEWKRLGLANKPLIVVPNHLTQQWQDSFTELYPAARVLVPTKEDFEKQNRKRLMAQIANNDWDAVVMAQSHFLRVSVKVETLRAFIKEQEDQMLADGAEQMHMSVEEFQTLVTDYGADDKEAKQALSARNAPRSVKDIARGILTLRARLQRRLNQIGKDAPVTFEELGVDGLLVDEAHLYKNLYFSTAMNGIAGLKGSDSDRAMDMFLKVRQINAQSKGRNVIFATGTPVSNTLSELFTMFRYLAQPTLDRMGMSGFDSWAHGNAEASAEMEKSAGTGYKERTRLRSWSNLRELSAQFRKFADVLTTEDLIASGAVQIPKRKGGSATVVALEPHPDMPAFMADIDARLEALKKGDVDPKQDNHLLVTTHAAMAAIDMRLVDPTAAPDPNGRIPTAAVEIAKRYKATAANKSTQIVFLDVGIPDAKQMPALPRTVTGGPAVELAPPTEEEDADPDLVDPEAEGEAAMAEIRAAGHARNLYEDLRQQLVAQGVKDNEIAYVHQAQTPYELGQLYAAVNDGRIRVLMASTSKGATGMNVQKKLIAIHHLDVPWRPADVEQRNGRIFRQGNENAEAEEVRYVTKRSFDEYRWSVLATKQQGIVALMKGQLTSMDDVDPSQLDYEVASALANGDPRALDLLNKERQIKALRTRHTAYVRRNNAALREVAAGESAIETYTGRAAAIQVTLGEARAWAETRQIALATRVSGYGESDFDQTFDLGDTDSRKALQDRLERLMRPEPYRDSSDIGEAGPYRLVLNRTTMDVWAAGNMTAHVGYFVTVKAHIGDELLVVGSTPTWQVGGEFPSFTRSLDFHMNPKKLAELADGYANQLRQWKEAVEENKQIAAKPFAQLDQLHQAEEELKTLRGELSGVAPALAADDTAPADAQSFDQPPIEKDARRGNVTFDTDPLTGRPRTRISLPANADLSTFLHESAHVFLEVFGDLVEKVRARDPETLTHSQQRLLGDYDALLKQFGVEDRAHIGRDQHEQFATQFERYLMAGEAPSIELRSAFARFRGWLLDIYRSLKNIGTPLSPELKGIFDRMLASEDEIDAAEHDAPALFTTADEAGMSPQRFAMYRTAMEDAHRVTREQLDRQITADVRAERSELRQAQRAEIAGAVTTALHEEPVYRALEAMRTGLKPDGTPLLEGTEAVPLQLAKAPLVAEFGEERVDALPAGIVSTTGGGTTAELVASVFGFGSGDELLQAVAAAPPLQQAIGAEVDRRMQAEHGSMLTDGTLRDRARAAVANTDRDALIRAEVKALWQKHEQSQRSYERRFLEAETKLRIAYAEGYKQVEIDKLANQVQELKATARGGAAAIRRALPSAKTLQAAAEARVARTKIRDLRPAVFWSAARQAAKKALELAAKQDIAGAIVAKTQELTNLANHRATVAALTDAQERQAWVLDHDTKAARGRTGLAGADYLDQWDGLLDRFEFKKVSRAVLDRRAHMAAWVAEQQANGLPVELPAIVMNDALTVNYQTLTVEQFAGVTDGLKALIHLAELKLGMLRAGERRSFEAVRDELADSIRAKTPEKPIPLEFRPSGAKWRSLENAVASHATLSTFGFQLDGNAYNGPFWEHIVRPANEAAAAEETRNIAASTAYHAILDAHYPGRELLSFGDKVFIPAINDSLSKEARLAIAFLQGSASGKARVLADPLLRWTPTQLAAVLDTLDKRDWDFAQAHWDYLNTFWPEIAAKSQRLTGLPPEKVEAVPVETKFGTYAGGYSPLVYDWRKSSEVGQTQAVSDAKLVVAGAAMYATTKRGHEETRLQYVSLPLRLDMASTSMHLSQVIHDLTHHEFLIDATRLLRDKAVAAAIHATRGPVVQQKLAKILLDIATGDRVPGRPTLIENGATWLRTRTQVAGLAWNLWTSLQQPLGIFNGMERVGIGWVAKGAGIWARDAVSMQNTVSMILDKSDMMRARYGTATQDLHDLRHTLSEEGGWFDRLVRTVSADALTQKTILDSYMEFIHFAQMFADKPTWLGEYLKQMDADPLDETRAIAAADQAVLDSQGGGQIKDLAEVQRGGQVGKLFMVFASYSTMVLNSTARAAGQTNFRSPASALTFAGHLALIYALPAFFTELLRCGVGRARCNEVPQFLERVGGQSLSTALNGVLYLREVVSDVNLLLDQEVGPRGYAGPAGTRIFEVVSQLATQIHQGHIDKGLERAAFAASGLLFRYPAAQVQRSVDGWVALHEGRTHNPAALLMGPPPKKQATNY